MKVLYSIGLIFVIFLLIIQLCSKEEDGLYKFSNNKNVKNER